MAYNPNAVDTVYDFILEKIQSGEWQAGARILPELKLAKSLGVSRVAVRDAIQKLAGMAVLRKQQGSGTYVEKVDVGSLMNALRPIVAISDTELLEIMEFRSYFEPGNVRQFLRACSDESLAALERNYEDMKAHRGDPVAFHQIDYDFHNMIAKGTQNSFVNRISDFYVDIIKAQQRYISMRLGPDIALEDHSLIIKYLKERQEDLAAMHMERHVKRAIESMRLYLAKSTHNK
jgi:Transcriptional regulators